MKFAFATALLAGLAIAAPSELSIRSEKAIEKRQGPSTLVLLGGIVSGVVGAAAKKVLAGNSKRSGQAFLEIQGNFAANLVNEISTSANDDEASLCVKTGNYTLDDDVKTRALATVELSSTDDNADFDCFFVSGSGTVTIDLDDLAENFSVKAGPCTFENLILTCTA